MTTGKTILVIDDSSSFRTVVKLALHKASYQVVEAADHAQAMAGLDAPSPDLIICDLDMSHMDGLSFARHVRATPRHRFTPLVMLTCSSQDDRKAEGRAAGVSAWVTKPFQPSQLVDVAARLCP